MQHALVPPNWTEDAKASAVLTVVHELSTEIANPRWRVATQAALRIPADQYTAPDCDSLAGRFRRVAQHEGTPETDIKARSEDYRGYWVSAAAPLADSLKQRLGELNRSADGWAVYRMDEPPSPPRSLPVSFDRTDVLFLFSGRRGIQSYSYRWLTAHGPVDHYDAVGWYYNEPDAPVEIIPLANCVRREPYVELPEGGRLARLEFERTLEPGEEYFFAYTTVFNSEQPCRPTILYEVRGLSMRTLTVRAQYDIEALPTKVWHFDIGIQSDGYNVPDDETPPVIRVGSNGFVQHEFSNCEKGRKYGLRWLW